MMESDVALHKEYDYVFKVYQLKDHNGIFLQFPNRVIKPYLNHYVVIYVCVDDTIEVHIGTELHEIVQCPKYAQRIYCISKLSVHLGCLGMKAQLLEVYDTQGNQLFNCKTMGLIHGPDEEEDIQKEIVLSNLVDELAKGESLEELNVKAIELGVKEGLDLIVDLFSQGEVE